MLVALLGPASPAFAHAAGGSDISNFSSTITSVSAMTSDGQPTQAGTLPNVSWRVVANDALLEVTNRSGEELLVVGYQGEPYLRVGPDGIWLNANSPASYLNGDRFAAVDVPAEANADAEPRWIRQPDQPTYAWHDHRIHWMSPTTDPPQVQESGGKTETTVFDWTVPYKVGSQTYAVAGTLRWVPPPPAGPWLLAGGAVTTLPFLVALTRARGSARRRALLRVGAVLAAGLVLTGVIHLVDDISAVPATFGQNLAETAKWGSFLLIGAVGAVVAWRARYLASTGLGFAIGGVSLGIGVSHMYTLARSQIASTIAPGFSRFMVAATLLFVVPAGLAAWAARGESQQHWGSPGAGTKEPTPA
jgi:hypothetical protein